MANLTREDAERMLDDVRTARMGFRVGLAPNEAEDVLLAYIDLKKKFDRVTACR